MAGSGGPTNVGMGDLEKDLTCSICTDILYQPLTLLNCLHSFCGSCLKEWFSWQAASAAQQHRTRRSTRPYTCPSCREVVRMTKADWRLTTLLEGYLKANPDRSKTEEEKSEISKHYKNGDDVLPQVRHQVDEDDSEDERLLAQVRDMSMTNVDPTGTRHQRRHHVSGEREPPQTSRLTESRLREHDAGGPQIGHQPSLRSLLSVSDTDPQDVQAEILQSIYSEGLLDGIDLDNLTAEQEEELTERIAEAYRRRQRHRDRSRNREHRHRESRSPRSPPHSQPSEPNVNHISNERSAELTPPQTHENQARPLIARPHLFEQIPHDSSRSHQGSRFATGEDDGHLTNQGAPTTSLLTAGLAPAESPNPPTAFEDNRTLPVNNENAGPRPAGLSNRERSSERPTSSRRHRTEDPGQRSANNDHPPSRSGGLPSPPLNGGIPSPTLNPGPVVRSVVSKSAFAPEPVSTLSPTLATNSIACNRCGKANIEHDIHYNCSSCLEGLFNLCLRCYREGRGCQHWFGFGYRAIERWRRDAFDGRPSHQQPHILMPRRYLPRSIDASRPDENLQNATNLQEGAFCENCFAFANMKYWYCSICLDGAWGFCDSCVKQGKHCTHQLLSVGHISLQTQPYQDPSKMVIVPLPHLQPESYVALPVPTFCDICHRPIPPNNTRFHCYQCNDGDYDICTECYHSLGSHGKINPANGVNGWRRCLKGHRMAIIGYQNTLEGAYLRIVIREPVGGLAFKEDRISLSDQIPQTGLPPDGGVGLRCLAIYSYFPQDGVTDELPFPKNAEIREVGKLHEEWFWGVYAGSVKLFPSNHVRIL